MARKLDPKSKAGFVRSQPLSMSAADVVAAARKAGIKLTESAVYAARAAKRKRNKAAKAPTANAPAAAAAKAAASRAGDPFTSEIEQMVERMIEHIFKEKFRI